MVIVSGQQFGQLENAMVLIGSKDYPSEVQCSVFRVGADSLACRTVPGPWIGNQLYFKVASMGTKSDNFQTVYEYAQPAIYHASLRLNKHRDTFVDGHVHGLYLGNFLVWV